MILLYNIWNLLEEVDKWVILFVKDKSEEEKIKMRGTRRTVANGMVWKMAEQILASLIQFLISVVIARLVLPEEYEIIALISVFITISDLLANAGFGTAIIQKKEIEDADISSVFVFSSCISVIIWILLFLAAPYISVFYGQPMITPVLRLYAIVIWPTSVCGLLRSILMRNLDFKKIFFSSAIPLIVSGSVGIVVALLGGGVYALTIQALVNAFLAMIILLIITKWHPSIRVNRQRIGELWCYSSKLLFANLLDTGYKNLYPLCIPKFFGQGTLSFYTYGRQIPNVLVSSINASVTSVMFSIFSKKQDNMDSLKASLRKTIRMCNFFIFPIMAGVLMLADAVIFILLGKTWMEAAWYLRFFCISYGLQHVQNIGFQAISACGKSEIYLKYEIIKKTIGVIILAVSLPLGIEILMWGQIFMAILFVLLGIYPNRKWINYKLREQLEDLIPFVIITGIMCVGVYGIGTLCNGMNLYLKVLIQVITGIVSYILAACVFHISELKDTYLLIKNFRHRK